MNLNVKEEMHLQMWTLPITAVTVVVLQISLDVEDIKRY